MALVDYAVLTPLDEEWRSARSALCPVWDEVTTRPTDQATYYLWRQPVNEPRVAVGEYLIVAAPMARRTPGQAYAAAFVLDCLNVWRPKRVVLLGIAGSFEPDRIKLGDVVVSDEVYGYEVGDAVGPERRKLRPTINQTNALDLDRVRALYNDPVEYPRWQRECMEAGKAAGFEAIVEPPNLHIEVTASGNDVVKSKGAARRLRQELNERISAVEMEGRGLYQALFLKAKRDDALMIRGVSDYADRRKSRLEAASKGGWRAYSSANAARLLRTLWRRGTVQPLSSPIELDVTRGPFSHFRDREFLPLDFKQRGAQDLAFPSLIRRSDPTPALHLSVRAVAPDGTRPEGYHGRCIVRFGARHSRAAVEGKIGENGDMAFEIPWSETGLHVELLLSFPSTMREIHLRCVDEFRRSAERTIGFETKGDRPSLSRHPSTQ